jgi:hypothetical protein
MGPSTLIICFEADCTSRPSSDSMRHFRSGVAEGPRPRRSAKMAFAAVKTSATPATVDAKTPSKTQILTSGMISSVFARSRVILPQQAIAGK